MRKQRKGLNNEEKLKININMYRGIESDFKTTEI